MRGNLVPQSMALQVGLGQVTRADCPVSQRVGDSERREAWTVCMGAPTRMLQQRFRRSRLCAT